jgi:peptide/nickel transport system permease protein
MVRFLLRKVPSVVLVLFASSIVAFALPRLAPGNVAVVLAGPDPSAEAVAAIRKQLGLNKPPLTQYWEWISGLFHGNLGQSYLLQRSVASVIGNRLDSTLELAIGAALFVVLIGLTLGVLAGAFRVGWVRSLLDLTNSTLIAIPSFLVGLALILFFGIFHHWLPVSGQVSVLQNPWTGIKYLILPVIALALAPGAVVARLIQTDMLRVRNEEFVDLAVSKGASPARITFRHVLRNSLGTAVVAVGLQFGNLLAGAVIIEAIFARNGLGQLAVSSVQTRDYTVLQVLILGAVLIAVVCQLLTEIVLAALDPRIRLGG